ncbi:hypothetical protein DFH07DRAFT_143603 [Mycena maculata]|uniref:Zn(2)-C6 fungal-type domain-containing protein n=1 Tax=Mycena maculata TaxID=230809 RepID=A0AAD7I0K8_9AGAR|nr:hypothetical protein DFH07DRAFT_143603 [Mycena maculata]
MMSDKNTQEGNSKERSQPLRRGKACLNCRHLKIKCDGIRPVCGPCTRVKKDDPCEYTDVASRTKELENTILALRTRINELEGAPTSSTISLRVQDPSLTGRSSPSCSSSGSRSSPQSVSNTENTFLGTEEPPLVIIRILLDSFLPHSTQFGFFLHLDNFRNSALLPVPFGHILRPSRALLSTAYLWGANLSQSQPLLSSEGVFLRRAQQHIATEISDSDNPAHLLHTIQAQVLLSTYMFRIKRFLEAEFHANGAATLVIGYQLHKIRSARPNLPPALDIPALNENHPGPPQSALEEGERIRAFWAVACLQNGLNISLPAASMNFSIFESCSADIDTPWPMEIADYEAGLLSPTYEGQQTIKAWLTDDIPLTGAPSMLKTQAGILLQRATRLGSKWSPEMQPQELASYRTSWLWLDDRINKFWGRLSPLYNFYTDSATARTLVIAYAMAAAAAIKLHISQSSGDEEAHAKCISAARAILACLGDTNIPDLTISHPIVGSLCMLACRVLMDEVRRTKMTQGAWGQIASLPPSLADLKKGIATMQMYALGSPLIEYQLTKLQQQYESLS